MSDFEITFLGTGTSVGVPMIGCDCEVCTSDDPRDQRFRSSIHVAAPEASWIVDTGPELRLQCLREGITHIDAVLYTHAPTLFAIPSAMIDAQKLHLGETQDNYTPAPIE